MRRISIQVVSILLMCSYLTLVNITKQVEADPDLLTLNISTWTSHGLADWVYCERRGRVGFGFNSKEISEAIATGFT